MKINVIKNHNNLIKVYPKGDVLLEVSGGGSPEGSFSLNIFDPAKNTVSEIHKNNIDGFHYSLNNCIYKSEDIYYFSFVPENGDYCLYKYSPESDDINIFSLKDIDINAEDIQTIRIFVLNETVFLIQTEKIADTKDDFMMGHIAFSQVLFNSESGSRVKINDENMNNNGINNIIPLSPTHIMIKTGFSYLEDSRYIAGEEYEAVIESVFVNMTSKFISDISLQGTSIDMELIDSTYFNRYIYKPDVNGDYILYTIVDPAENVSYSIFYNYITKEKFTCKNTDFDENDICLGYVLKNTPYERNALSLQTDFLNLKTRDYDFSCMGKEFIDIVGDLLILGDTKLNRKAVTRVYSYPRLDLILEEKGTYITGCVSNDKYYLYFR